LMLHDSRNAHLRLRLGETNLCRSMSCLRNH
jgi:hypothetical protein